MVEHNLSVVSTLSDHITVLARGEMLAEGDYAHGVAAPGRRRGLPGTGACLTVARRAAPALRRRRRAAARRARARTRGTASRTSCTASTFDVARRRGRHAARPQRRGQDDDAASRSWASCRGARDRSRSKAARRSRLAVEPHRPPRHRLLPGGARHLREPQRRGEPAAAAGRARRRAVGRADLRAVPEPASERLREPGHEAVRRRAADARDRPHPAHRRAAAAARRADRRPGAGDRPADRPHHRASSRRRVSRSCWSSRISASRRRSRTGTT